MSHLPTRNTLVSQTADILRAQIITGTWRGRLPAERALCEKYQISRNTLRAALAQLQNEKLIGAVHGSGNRILMDRAMNSPAQVSSQDVGLLSPVAIEHLRPNYTLWINELRAMLGERSSRLHVHHGRQYFRKNPDAALARLVRDNPRGCWILVLSNEPVQRWFAKNSIPCVVAGSLHAGLELPSCDLDHRAISRHAAGVMLGCGHRKLAMMMPKSEFAGDIASEAGFHEGVRHSKHEGVEVLVRRVHGDVGSIVQGVQRLMRLKIPPTALFVLHTFHYVTVATQLMQMGKRIPQDISIISRDDDLFLSYIRPTPARYRADYRTFARSLLRPVLELMTQESVTKSEWRMMPQFVRGESIQAQESVK